MSKLNTLANIADLAVGIHTNQKIGKLVSLNESAARAQESQQALRSAIHSLSEETDGILNSSQKDTLDSAFKLSVLLEAVDEYGLAPDLFNELNDKKFASDVISRVRGAVSDLRSRMTKSQKEAFLAQWLALGTKDECDIYLKTFPPREEHMRLERSRGVAVAAGIAGLGAGYFMLIMETSPEVFATLCALSISAIIGSILFFHGLNTARDSYDVSQFLELQDKYKSRPQAFADIEKAEKTIRRFERMSSQVVGDGTIRRPEIAKGGSTLSAEQVQGEFGPDSDSGRYVL
jgi:hypothetical protein